MFSKSTVTRVYGKYSTRGRLIQHKAKLSVVFASRYSAVFFVLANIGSALSVLLYFLVVLLGAIFLITQIASIVSVIKISVSCHIVYL